MRMVLEKPEEIEKRWRQFPDSAIRDKKTGEKTNYYEFITSLQNKDCNEALKGVMSKIDMKKIQKVVNDTPYISNLQKKFYKVMLQARYENILLNPYECLLSKEKELCNFLLEFSNFTRI